MSHSLLQEVLDIRGGVAYLRQSPFYRKLAAVVVCGVVQEGNDVYKAFFNFGAWQADLTCDACFQFCQRVHSHVYDYSPA